MFNTEIAEQRKDEERLWETSFDLQFLVLLTVQAR
jgi:hypothetical protein